MESARNKRFQSEKKNEGGVGERGGRGRRLRSFFFFF